MFNNPFTPAISSGGSGLPSRMILHGTEGVGKSSLGAFAPRPIFGMTRNETGLLTLIDNGLIPDTDHFDEVFYDWNGLIGAVDYLTANDTGYKTFVLDTLNGAERLCFEHVCQTQYGGSWDGFTAYAKGYDVSQGDWINFLAKLDRLREQRRMAIILLCHTKIKTYKNPEGDDYDRYTPDLHEKIWGLSHKWADIVLFANFRTFAEKGKGVLKAKGIGGTERVLFTSRTAAFDAKNRVGLPTEIPVDGRLNRGHPDGMWRCFYNALRVARQTRQGAAQAGPKPANGAAEPPPNGEKTAAAIEAAETIPATASTTEGGN